MVRGVMRVDCVALRGMECGVCARPTWELGVCVRVGSRIQSNSLWGGDVDLIAHVESIQ